MLELDTWDLIQNGQFEQACEIADLEFEKTGNIFPLRNKIYALLHLRRYEECVNLTRELIEMRKGETESDFIFCGIANWCLKNYSQSIEMWIKGRDSKYSDPVGGIELEIILYYAAVARNEDYLKGTSRKIIKNKLRRKNAVNWPGPLGAYVIDDIDQSELLSNVTSLAILRERQLCQSNFAIALKELEKGEMNAWKSSLRASINQGSASYLESMYYLAEGELNF